MIDRDRTIKEFGYDPDELSKGSHKKVVAVCIDCKKERILIFKAYRDLCRQCSYKRTFIKERNQKIDEERTKKDFGYTSDELSDGSNKRVWAICKRCGEERILKFSSYGDLCKSCAFFGRKHLEGTKEKIGKANFGRKHSEKTKIKMSESTFGKNNPNYGKFGSDSPNWKGGKGITGRKKRSKRNNFLDSNPIELNKDFKECNGHHVNRKYIINIPVELHRSIYHRQSDGRGMHEMNKIAFKYLVDNKKNMIVSEETALYINLMCL